MTDNTEREQVGWRFWLRWVIASSVGLAVGFGLTVGLGVAVGPILSGAMLGASIGIPQWLILHGQIPQAGRWVLASTVGMAVSNLLFGVLAGAIGGAILGASIGIAQWLILGRLVSRAGWWILASAVPFAVLGTLSFLVGTATIETYAQALVCLSLVVWIGYGAITGGVLVWLLRQPISEEPSLPQDAA